MDQDITAKTVQHNFSCCCTGSQTCRELWRLRFNWFITLLLSPVLYSVSFVGVLSSLHRYVTDPTNGTLYQNVTIEGGLGESELFYSLVIAAQNIGAAIGSLLMGIIVLRIPFLYLYLTAIVSHIVGYVLYGIATKGWILLIGELCAGFYLGSQGTLSYSYATKSAVAYVMILKGRSVRSKRDEEMEVKIRNLLFTLKTVGNSLGSFIGAGTGILLANLPVDQYRSIAWVNIGTGVLLLAAFLMFFRKEYRFRKNHTEDYQDFALPSNQASIGCTEIFILLSMYSLVFVDVFKWGFFDTLLNPILSDSFGFNLTESSYFYLGFSVARIVAALSLTLMQQLKVKSQVIGIIAVLSVTAGYIVIADWQAIPYDPCTNCSPYHHPDLFKNESGCFNITRSAYEDLSSQSNYEYEFLSSDSQLYEGFKHNNLVLARNACMSAHFDHKHCHWIPNSTISHNYCGDCQPLCRSIEQTLSFPQFLIGMSLLVATNPLIFYALTTTVSNQVPLKKQGFVLGILFTVSSTAQSICPIVLDAMYEGFQKRTFAAAAAIAALHLPFLFEFIIMFKKLGPRLNQETKYKKLLPQNFDEESFESGTSNPGYPT